jgi:hypothetical protein
VTAAVINKRVTTKPIGIANPNGTIMYSTHIAELDLPSLPPAARLVHIVPALNATSLLSMGQLCDAGCVVTFDAKTVTVKLNDERILDGVRTPATGLWQLSMVKPTLSPPLTGATSPLPLLLHHSFAAVQSATPAELVTFAHGCFVVLSCPIHARRRSGPWVLTNVHGAHNKNPTSAPTYIYRYD